MSESSGTGRVAEVFRAFSVLGVSAFGGPVAHLGYFRNEFVNRRRWLGDSQYADLVALCQFLPGPASSQVGFALGLMRAGPLGAAAAWLAFTLPSALLLVLFALGAGQLEGTVGQGAIGGLKVAAVAIVAHAVWGMSRSLCPDRARAVIALGAVALALLAGGSVGQVCAIALGALAGAFFCRGGVEDSGGDLHFPVSPRAGGVALALFLALLVGLPLLAWLQPAPPWAVMEAFYRAGALVFGGGHVVLPLLEAGVVQTGWVSPEAFLTGYGAAQAIPGPLFTFAAYLGALIAPTGDSWVGALLALVMIFLPGLLLLVAVLPYWNRFRRRENARALMRGANAAVVGILGAALYDPVFSSAVTGPAEFVLALAGFMLLTVWGTPAWAVVALSAYGGAVISL